MCGINGFTAPAGERAEAPIAHAMNRALHHRGPDEGGVADLGFAALAMRRLAIVDIADGHQPMRSADGRWTLVYNGEIYDFDALRARLAARGRVFATRSDTEVVLQSWIEHGVDSLPHFNGMFSFAVADQREHTLTLARDPLGIKPLYWTLGPRRELIFSSELKSLLAHPAVSRRLDRKALEMLLVDRYVADPWTLIEGVQRLPPGHWLRWRNGEVELRRYRELKLEPVPQDERAATEELRATLDDVVRSQLVADVPVGVFLSGGVDSSTVAAFASRAVREGGRKLKTFSIGFARKDYDESELARAVAKHIGAEHFEARIERSEFSLDALDRILDHVGEPLGDTSCIPTLAVSELAANEVKVVLSGDGGDEMFGGYDHMFWAARVRRLTDSTPAPLRRAGLAMLAAASPMTRGALATKVRRARKGLELSMHKPEQQFRRMRSLWTPEEARELCAHDFAVDTLRSDCELDVLALAELAPEEYVMDILAKSYMPGAILAKVDRMSMAASLEVRVPLLDRRVVDFASRLPLDLKVRNGVGKHLLREAGRPLLPREVYEHRKQGFAIPLFDWFNGEFWELVDGLYAPGSRAAELFQRPALERALSEGRSADERTGVLSETAAATRVWLLASLARWMQRFGVAA
jgi:asparagine synthase (glutamine-hydrolysing)